MSSCSGKLHFNPMNWKGIMALPQPTSFTSLCISKGFKLRWCGFLNKRSQSQRRSDLQICFCDFHVWQKSIRLAALFSPLRIGEHGWKPTHPDPWKCVQDSAQNSGGAWELQFSDRHTRSQVTPRPSPRYRKPVQKARRHNLVPAVFKLLYLQLSSAT